MLQATICNESLVRDITLQAYDKVYTQSYIFLCIFCITIIYNAIIFQLYKHKKINPQKFIKFWGYSSVAQGAMGFMFIGILFLIGV